MIEWFVRVAQLVVVAILLLGVVRRTRQPHWSKMDWWVGAVITACAILLLKEAL